MDSQSPLPSPTPKACQYMGIVTSSCFQVPWQTSSPIHSFHLAPISLPSRSHLAPGLFSFTIASSHGHLCHGSGLADAGHPAPARGSRAVGQLQEGQNRDGEIPDSELALEACRYELESMENLISDRSLSLSIARAVEADGGVIAAARAAEDQAARDREFALRLSSNPRARPGRSRAKANKKAAATDDLDDEMIEKLKAMYIGMTGPTAFASDLDDTDLFPQAESSSWAATGRHAKTRECISCRDQFPQLSAVGMPLLPRILPRMPRQPRPVLPPGRVPVSPALLRPAHPHRGKLALPVPRAGGRVQGQEGRVRDAEPHVLQRSLLLDLCAAAVYRR
ncbi:hypothetical protein ACJZ2D_011606 [Fusarium nematophilum]